MAAGLGGDVQDLNRLTFSGHADVRVVLHHLSAEVAHQREHRRGRHLEERMQLGGSKEGHWVHTEENLGSKAGIPAEHQPFGSPCFTGFFQ